MITELPLLVDSHRHDYRGENWEHKGTIATETRSALASGIGTSIIMPNSNPPIMTYDELLRVRRMARDQACCDVGFYFGSLGENTLEFTHVAPFVHGIKVYLGVTTGGSPLSMDTTARIFTAWTIARPILVHVEEADVLNKVISLAAQHVRHLHVCHVNLAEEVSLIRQAKEQGVSITAEVCPHHLIFSENDLPDLGPYGIMKPPLGQPSDVEALWQGLEDGTIDMIATDHAPHSQEEKASSSPPFGVIGEPAFQVMWAEFHNRGLPIETLIRFMRERPAAIFGLRIDDSSHTEVELDATYRFEREMIPSRAGRSPYEGRQVRGRIRKVFLHGLEVMHDGDLIFRNGKVI
jgi:dihydroorotase-like cyclic amidohydrolase